MKHRLHGVGQLLKQCHEVQTMGNNIHFKHAIRNGRKFRNSYSSSWTDVHGWRTNIKQTGYEPNMQPGEVN